MTLKGKVKDPCDHGNVLYFDCVNINVPVVIWYYIVMQDMTTGEN